MDTSSSSLCLHLNSCPPSASRLMNPNSAAARRNPKGSAGKNQVTPRVYRSRKNTAPSMINVTPHKQAAEILQPSNKDSVDVTPARKTKRRSRGANSRVDVDQAKKGDDTCSNGLCIESVDVDNSVNNNDCSKLVADSGSC